MKLSETITLLKAVRGVATLKAAPRLAKLIAIAEESRDGSLAQSVAAFEAWTQGQRDWAISLAMRSQRLEWRSYPALIVLIANRAYQGNELRTYELAKQLIQVDTKFTSGQLLWVLNLRQRLHAKRRIGKEVAVEAIACERERWLKWAHKVEFDYEHTHRNG
jgi:hypothetical protein